MDEWEELKDIYRKCVFNKKELEEQIGIDLSTLQKFVSVPEGLKSFLSRTTIQLKEAANIMSGYRPLDHTQNIDEVEGYKASLWDAIDNNILNGKNIVSHEYLGEEVRDDITLNKNEVTKWANKYNYYWPFPLDQEYYENNQNSNETGKQIKLLEEELAYQKKNNSNLKSVNQNLQISLNNNQDLIDKINNLKLDNEKLTDLLNKANADIEELKKQVPILLGKYRQDDPLLLAIQTRNREWANYDEKNQRSKPTQAAICADLRGNYGVTTEQLAKAIELVSCPINRSK